MAMSAGLCVENLTGTMISGHRGARRVTAEAKPTIPHSKGSWMSSLAMPSCRPLGPCAKQGSCLGPPLPLVLLVTSMSLTKALLRLGASLTVH